MSLKNETQSVINKSRYYVGRYTEGMNRERINIDYKADRERLQKLYHETVMTEQEYRSGEEIGIHVKVGRLFTALVQRLNPVRRLAFFGTLFAFILPYFADAGLLTNLMHPVAFLMLIVILFIELLEKLDAKKEIDLAREIQLSLLPPPEIKSGNLEIVSFANTAQEVGGDYVDVIETPVGKLVIVADVSGKGLSAALYMVRMQALVHLLTRQHRLSPRELFLELNTLIKSGRKDKTFVTACAAFFPKDQDHFLFCRAGHNHPFLFNMAEDKVRSLRNRGLALGMTTQDLLEEHLEEAVIPFRKGDTLLLYTDGLNEARNEQGEEFGEDRIESVMEIYASINAKTVVQKLQASLEEFIGSAKPVDDITFTVIHRNS